MGLRGSDITSDMFAAPLVLGLLVSVVSGGVIISQDKEQERLLNLLPGLALNLAHDQWLALLGVTTTRATPVLDIIGGLLPGEETTTTTTAPCGGLLGLGLLSPCEETTTAAEETTTTSGGEETTTAGETTTTAAPCGGLLGLGLLAEPCSETTTTTTTTTTTACGGLLGGGLLC